MDKASPAPSRKRRSGRIARRTNVSLHRRDSEGKWAEIPAETLVLSRHGCLVASPAKLKLNDEVFLWSPGRLQGVQARVVSLAVNSATQLVEIGVEFIGSDDFWNIEFPAGVTPEGKPSGS